MSVVERALRIANEHPDEILAIVGPTASGKTALAVTLAEKLGGEVVGADSVQIYREFDIGSGKPTGEQLAMAPHHLVSALGPLEPIDAASWAERAIAAIENIRRRGRIPILCGGTFLWLKALVFGLAEAPAANDVLRDKHRVIAENEGRPALHALLRAVDPDSAARLHPNDLVRVSRALEVFEMSGKPLSAWQREHAFSRVRRSARFVALECDSATLTERIRDRARAWLAQGWIEEVRSLQERGYGAARAMGSVGYTQIQAMLSGQLPSAELELAVVRATRVFARRQRTWLNHADVIWLSANS